MNTKWSEKAVIAPPYSGRNAGILRKKRAEEDNHPVLREMHTGRSVAKGKGFCAILVSLFGKDKRWIP